MEKIFASIITIGDELLIGQVVDTNSPWMAQELNKIGVAVKHRVAVGDVWDDIWYALNEESKHADIILITGGLGPTADDITKPLLCDFFGGKMVVDEATRTHVTHIFANILKRPMIERNAKQAEVPDVCTVLKNDVGTAPGMLFERDGKIFIAWANQGIIFFDRSYDGGNMWLTSDLAITKQVGGWDMKIPGIDRSNGLPILMVDNGPDRYHGGLYLVWADQRNGENDTDIMFMYSNNRGDNWSDPKRINQDAKGKHQLVP